MAAGAAATVACARVRVLAANEVGAGAGLGEGMGPAARPAGQNGQRWCDGCCSMCLQLNTQPRRSSCRGACVQCGRHCMLAGGIVLTAPLTRRSVQPLTGAATHFPAAHSPGRPPTVQGPGNGMQAPPGPQASHWLSH